MVSPAAVARMNAIMGVLRQAATSEDAARRAYATIHTYTLGFAALQASRAAWTPTDDTADGLALQLANYTQPTQFADGLQYILEGIQRDTRKHRPL